MYNTDITFYKGAYPGEYGIREQSSIHARFVYNLAYANTIYIKHTQVLSYFRGLSTFNIYNISVCNALDKKVLAQGFMKCVHNRYVRYYSIAV